MTETKTFRFTRPGDLGKQTLQELQAALTFYAVEGNRYAAENIVKQMGSRRGMTGAEMAAAIKRGEF